MMICTVRCLAIYSLIYAHLYQVIKEEHLFVQNNLFKDHLLRLLITSLKVMNLDGVFYMNLTFKKCPLVKFNENKSISNF